METLRKTNVLITVCIIISFSSCKIETKKGITVETEQTEEVVIKDPRVFDKTYEDHIFLYGPSILADFSEEKKNGITIQTIEAYGPANSEIRYYQEDGKILGAAGNSSECSYYSIFKIKYTDDGVIEGVLLATTGDLLQQSEEENSEKDFILNFLLKGDTANITVHENIEIVRNDKMEVIGILNQRNTKDNLFIKDAEQLDWCITQSDDFWASDINGSTYKLSFTLKKDQSGKRYKVVTYDKFDIHKEEFYNDTILTKTRQYCYYPSSNPPEYEIFEYEQLPKGHINRRYLYINKWLKEKEIYAEKVSPLANGDTLTQEIINKKIRSEKLVRNGRLQYETEFSLWGTPLSKKEYKYTGESVVVRKYKIDYKTKKLKRVS